MKRASGVLMHISSLWGDYSIGSFGKEARSFIDFIKSCGFSYWQVLPFCLPDECNSPYKSYGAFSGNPYFIDLETLCDKGYLKREELLSQKQRNEYLCEFERLKSERIDLLIKASTRFTETLKMEAFYNENPQILNFCKFMALKKANNDLPFNLWTVDFYDESYLFAWKFIEYEFFTQLLSLKKYANEKGIKIIGDMPIYVDYDSADVYFNKSEFLLDKKQKPTLVAGVPPDYFSKDGQLWGNPLYDYKKMENNGFLWWQERLNFYKKFFDGVRIDHFRAFSDYYAIKPTETTAKNGKWIKGPKLKLINKFKQIKGDFLIIAEDLGVITEDVVKLVKQSGFPGMRVLQFGFLGDKNSPHLPHNYINNSVAYTGTHDNNTLLGYVWEQQDSVKEQITKYFGVDFNAWNSSYDQIIRQMISSPAGLTMFQIQDLLKFGSDTRMNTPGKKDGNWAFRITKQALEKVNINELKYYNEIYGR